MHVCLVQQPYVLGKISSLSSCGQRPCQAASSTAGPFTAAGWASAEGHIAFLGGGQCSMALEVRALQQEYRAFAQLCRGLCRPPVP